MKKYNLTFSATCPPEKRRLFEQEIQNGYTVQIFGHTAILEGRRKTEEDFRRIDHLIRDFPDHRIIVKEVKEDGEKV